MSVNRKETIRDPNSFKDINYELLIDFRLTVDGYLHNTPPVKEYSWEEFQRELEIPGVEKAETFLDSTTFENCFRCLIMDDEGDIIVPFFARSYFNVFNDNTLRELEVVYKFARFNRDTNKVKEIIGKVSQEDTERILKG